MNLNHQWDMLNGDAARLGRQLDALGRKMDKTARQRRVDTLSSVYKQRGFDDHHAESYAKMESRRETWSAEDETRVKEFCKLNGWNFNDASGYAKAVSAVALDQDLPGNIDPVLLRLRDIGGDPNDYQQYSAAATAIYMLDSESGETILKNEFSKYGRKD